MNLDIDQTMKDGKCVIVVRGEVDLNSSPELRTALTTDMPNGTQGIAVHLGEVAYMDSSGVATLIEGLRDATAKKIDFVLIAPSQAVFKVLQLSRLDSVFTIQEAG